MRRKPRIEESAAKTSVVRKRARDQCHRRPGVEAEAHIHVGLDAGSGTPVHHRHAAGMFAGQFHGYRARSGVEQVGMRDREHGTGIVQGCATGAGEGLEPLQKERERLAREPAGGGVDLPHPREHLVVHGQLVGQVEAAHDDSSAAAEDAGGGFGVRVGVELGGGGDVAVVGAATHDGDAGDALRPRGGPGRWRARCW